MLRLLSSVAFAMMLSVASATFAIAEQIWIYDRPGFVGEDFHANYSVPDLGGSPVTRKAGSLRARDGAWLACTEANYNGNCIWIWRAQISNLGPWRFENIRSLRLYRQRGERLHWPTRLHIYAADRLRESITIAEDDYEGEFRTITGDVPDLKAAGMDFPIGGFIITGPISPHAWALCTEPNYGGRCLVTTQTNDVMAEVFTDRIASIRALPTLRTTTTDPPRFYWRRGRW